MSDTDQTMWVWLRCFWRRKSDELMLTFPIHVDQVTKSGCRRVVFSRVLPLLFDVEPFCHQFSPCSGESLSSFHEKGDFLPLFSFVIRTFLQKWPANVLTAVEKIIEWITGRFMFRIILFFCEALCEDFTSTPEFHRTHVDFGITWAHTLHSGRTNGLGFKTLD